VTLSVNIAIDARHNELLCALSEIAKRRGLDEPLERANDSKRKILRAIERARSEKLNAWHYQRFKEKTWKTVPLRPTVKWAIILVRRAANEYPSLRLSTQPRLNREEAIINATSITRLDLRPIERRAVEILCGSRPKSKKNFLEERAERLANAVNRDWFSADKGPGRSQGASSCKRIEIRGHSYQVPLSATEVIAAVMPSIEDLAGPSNERRIPVLRALVAAVRIAVPNISRDSIARIATRVRATKRKLEKPCPTSQLK
jgi:hypothetical protein